MAHSLFDIAKPGFKLPHPTADEEQGPPLFFESRPQIPIAATFTVIWHNCKCGARTILSQQMLVRFKSTNDTDVNMRHLSPDKERELFVVHPNLPKRKKELDVQGDFCVECFLETGSVESGEPTFGQPIV